MKRLFFSLLIIASAFLINIYESEATSIESNIGNSEQLQNNDSDIKNKNNVDSSSNIDDDIFGDEQTFPFVAGLGKNAAH